MPIDKEDMREIYGLLREIKEDLAEMRAEKRIDHEKIVELDERIDKVESILDRAMGAKAILCVICSVIGAAIVAMIQYFHGR